MELEKQKEPYLSRISKTWPMSLICLLFLVKMYFDRPEIFPFLFVFVGILLGLFLLADKYINKKPSSNYVSITDQGIIVEGMDIHYSDIVKLVDQYGYISVYTQAKKPIKLRKSEYPVKDLSLGVSLIKERAGLNA